MATVDPIFAVLSAAVYENGRREANLIVNLPDGVTPVDWPALAHFRDDATGFEAGAYFYNDGITTRIVISYAGTLPGPRDFITDGALGLGIADEQMLQAAVFYERVREQYGDNIVFTGHSLGGGLAALMGVFFNKEAVTFDPAPFRLAATEGNAQRVAEHLAYLGYGVDANLTSYSTTELPLAIAVPDLLPYLLSVHPFLSIQLGLRPYPVSIRGEERISAVALRGEFLSNDLLDQLRIVAGDVEYVEHGGVEDNGGFALHSMALLTCFTIEPTLAELSIQLPKLVGFLLDEGLYGRPIGSEQTDILIQFLNNEYAVPGGGALSRFAADLQVLTAPQGTLQSSGGIRNALIVAAMEYHYFREVSGATNLFQVVDGAVHFRYSDIGTGQYESRPLLAQAVANANGITDSSLVQELQGRSAWHIQTGAGAMAWIADLTESQNDVAMGGIGNDGLSSGAGNDVLFGGLGNDGLEGGSGYDILYGGIGDDVLFGNGDTDRLYGGVGFDQYHYATGDGIDIIEDSDGLGVIFVNGVALNGANAEATTYRNRRAWQLDIGGQTAYIIEWAGSVDTQATLRIEGPAFGPDGFIQVQKYTPDDLGLTLDNASTTLVGNGQLREGLASRLQLVLATFAGTSQVVRFQVSELAAHLQLVTGAETLAFNPDGTLDVTLEAGQAIFNYALLSQGDVDADASITLSAVLLDADGNPYGDVSALNIAFDAVDELSAANPAPVQTLTGTEAGESFIPQLQLTQGNLNRTVYGLGGDDFIDLMWGVGATVNANDYADGGLGRDTIFGWLGDDRLLGGGDRDRLSGDEGNDTIEGGEGADYIFGGWGDDRLFADSDQELAAAITAGALPGIEEVGDLLSDGLGDDLLVGSSRQDIIAAGGGNDVLVGGGGSDLLFGDSYITPTNYQSWSAQWTTLAGGFTQSRMVQADGSMVFGYDIPFMTEVVVVPGGADSIYAGSGDDGVFAGGGDDFVDGGDGDDVILGQLGNDTLLGGEGNDYLDGGEADDTTGADFLDGGSGDDRLYGAGGNDVLFGGAGNDFLQADDGDAFDGDDYLNGEDGDDILSGGGGTDLLIGGAGNDSLYGDFANTPVALQGDDYLDGGAGNDVLVGEGGADTLIGGDGDDHLSGESSSTPEAAHGDDHLDGGNGSDVLVGGGANDTLIGGADNDFLYGDASDTPLALHGDDYLDGGDGDDVLFGEGGKDTLIGGAGDDNLVGDSLTAPIAVHGDDFLDGGAGNDALFGFGGNDTLLGGEGTDYLDGGAGDDILIGGLGIDSLRGGSGNDTYVFDAGDFDVVNNAVDGINDTEGVNRIEFRGGLSSTEVTVSAGGAPGSI